MTDAPERVYMDPDIKFPECEKQYGYDVGYVRADLYEALAAERDRLVALVKTMTARAEVASRYQDDRFNFGWMIKEAHATLAKMEKTDE